MSQTASSHPTSTTPAHPSAPDSGLIVGQHTAPLQQVTAEAWITGRCARVTLTQRFQHHEATAIEAIYAFPLPPDAAVCGFEAHIDQRRVKAHIETREQAFDTYDDALADGDGAFLLEQHRADVFTVSLGNLTPGQTVLISIQWVILLPDLGGVVRFTLPTTIAPRQPAQDAQPSPPQPAISDNPGYGLSVTVHARQTPPLRVIEAPSHPVRLTVSPDEMTVSLSSPRVSLDRDFVLTLEPQEARTPRATVARDDDGEHVAMITLYPDDDGLPGPPREVWMIVDTSTSMTGDPLALARQAAWATSEALSAVDKLNVLHINPQGHATTLWPEPRRLNTDTRAELRAHLSALKVSEVNALQPALRHLTKLQRTPDPRLASSDLPTQQVIVLTAGATHERPLLADLCRQIARLGRVFVIAVGAAPGMAVAEAMARAGRGTLERLHPGEAARPVALRTAARLGEPTTQSISVAWEGMNVTQAPTNPAAVFQGEPLTFFARIHEGAQGVAVVQVDERAWRVPVHTHQAQRDPTIVALWARAAIEDMEARLTRQRGSARRDAHHAQRRQALIALSRRHGILSSATSFVAVEARDTHERTTQQAPLRVIPTATIAQGLVEDRLPALQSSPTPASVGLGQDTPPSFDMSGGALSAATSSGRSSLPAASSMISPSAAPHADPRLSDDEAQHTSLTSDAEEAFADDDLADPSELDLAFNEAANPPNTRMRQKSVGLDTFAAGDAAAPSVMSSKMAKRAAAPQIRESMAPEQSIATRPPEAVGPTQKMPTAPRQSALAGWFGCLMAAAAALAALGAIALLLWWLTL